MSKTFSKLLVCYGLACFLTASLVPVVAFIISSVDALGSEMGLAITLVLYVLLCLLGIPVIWFVLIIQGLPWLPVLALAASRPLWIQAIVVVSAPVAAWALFKLGIIATRDRLDGFTIFNLAHDNPVVIESAALTITTIAFFVLHKFLQVGSTVIDPLNLKAEVQKKEGK